MHMHSYTLTITHPLPFTPSSEQAIYIEGEYDERINIYIRTHHDRILKEFHAHGLEFCYLPVHAVRRAEAIYRHHNPGNELPDATAFATRDFVAVLFNGNAPADLKPSVIIFMQQEGSRKESMFQVVEFMTDEMVNAPRKWWQRLLGKSLIPSGYRHATEWMASILSCASHGRHNDGVHYRTVNFYDEELQRYLREHEGEMMELQMRIHMLQNQGVDSLILKRILNRMVDENRPLSRVVITRDLRILLPDYQDMEIRMEPVNKALFLLFLRHEEGIRIKELVDYRSELESFYGRLSHDDGEKRRATINSLIDPTGNSIHEKISRIREAFIARFAEDLAENYFITGPRGEAKRIRIDRSMVTWE